jgi:hypothetical protein
MGDFFNDALQEYQAFTGTTIITADGSNIPIGEIGENGDVDLGSGSSITDFLELKLEDNVFNLYLKNENLNGNIFIKNDNVDNKVKIEDGVLYVFYDYNPLTSLLIPSGWTEVADYIVGAYQGTLNNAAAIAGLEGQIVTIQTQIPIISAAVFALETTAVDHETRIIALQLNTIVENPVVIATRTTNLAKLTDAIANLGQSFFNQVINVTSMSSLITILSTRAGTLYAIGIAATLGSTLGGVIALGAFISDNIYKAENYNKLNKIAKTLEILDSNPNKDVVNVIHIDGLSIDPATKTGYTTNGTYEVTIINDAKLIIKITNGEAFIDLVLVTKDNFTAPSTILIPVSQVGGNPNFSNLIINVNTVYSLVQILILESTKVLNEDKAIDNRQRRRQLIPAEEDFTDGITVTQTTDTLESGEALPKLEIKLNINDDHFYFNNTGELLIKKITNYKFDGLNNIDNVNSAWVRVVDDIRNNLTTAPTSLIMENVYLLYAQRVIGLKQDRTLSILIDNSFTKRFNNLIVEQKFLNICNETYDLFSYWRNQWIEYSGTDAGNYTLNKVDNFYVTQNPPSNAYVPAEFIIQNGVYICNDITGYGFKMFFEISYGVIVQSVMLNWGNLTVPINGIISFSKDDMGGYTGTSGIISYSVYDGLTSTDTIMREYNVFWIYTVIDKCDKRLNTNKELINIYTGIANFNPGSGLQTSSTNNIDEYTREALTQYYLKIKFNANHLNINASNELEVSPNLINTNQLAYNTSTAKIGINTAFFKNLDFVYNSSTDKIELLYIGKPFFPLPLNPTGIYTSYNNMVNWLKDATVSGVDAFVKVNIDRMYYNRILQLHSLKLYFVNEDTYDFNDTAEMIDSMYMDIYKEQFGIFAEWYKRQLVRTPVSTAINYVSTYRLLDTIDPTSNLLGSYATPNGVYEITDPGTGNIFYIEIFKGVCVDIRAGPKLSGVFANSSYTFNIPKSLLGGAVAGQAQDLTFTSNHITATVQGLYNDMVAIKAKMYNLALRRLQRYGGLNVLDLRYNVNPTGGFKVELQTPQIPNRITGETIDYYKVSVNLDLNDFYYVEDNGEIALNLVNKIDGTLIYDTETRKIGIDTTAAQTFGDITTGSISAGTNAIGCGAITSTGALSVINEETNIAVFKHTNLTQGVGIRYDRLIAIGSAGTQNIYLESKSTGSVIFRTNGADRVIVNGAGLLTCGAFECGTISSTSIITNNNNVNVGNGVVVAGKAYLGHATTAGWNGQCYVAGNTATAGNDGSFIFGKNDGAGGVRYGKIGFNNSFEICIGDASSTVNGTVSNIVRIAYNAAAGSFVMDGDGNVGIGRTPSAKLHVTAGYTETGSVFMRYFNSGQNITTATINVVNVCAIFDTSIWCKSSFISASDSRIKNNIEDINEDLALDKILKIKPKTYNYIDVVNKGDKRVYGFIAQQINEVLPEAVSLQKDIIPNIYDTCKCVGNKIYIANCEASINTKIDIIDLSGNRQTYTINEVTENYIIIDKEIEGAKCFVYGYEIDDHHSIDKTYIFTLNVGATQRLHRKIEEQRAEIDELKAKLDKLMVYLGL